jgi:hypothetical protein
MSANEGGNGDYADWCRIMRLREELRRKQLERERIRAKAVCLERAIDKWMKEVAMKENVGKSTK